MDTLEFTRVPQSREAIATILATLILADLQAGQARSVPDSVSYGPGGDVIASPDECIARGNGNSADLVRLVGATQGDQVGCVGDPVTGFHCFLLAAGHVLDPSRPRGGPALADAVYSGAATAPIRRPAPLKPVAAGEPVPGLPSSFTPILDAAKADLSAADQAKLQEVARLLTTRSFEDLAAEVSKGGAPAAVELAAVCSHAVRAQPDLVVGVLQGNNSLFKACLALARLVADAAAPPTHRDDDAIVPAVPRWPRIPTWTSFRRRGLTAPNCSGSCGTRY